MNKRKISTKSELIDALMQFVRDSDHTSICRNDSYGDGYEELCERCKLIERIGSTLQQKKPKLKEKQTS